MAFDTSPELRNKIIYEVFIRNHSEAGNFNGLQKDLPRIKNLGVDVIWLMPIHPIGRIQRKHSLGCPYSIQDYREINPEYGTADDFQQLVSNIHELGMEVMIDIVFNHTSHDSWLRGHHPEWFYRAADGKIAGKVEDWTDVIDLDYTHPELWTYQIDTLKFWTKQGVNGFRCDVAPLVPLDFWLKARSELKKINPNLVWLAESSDPDFIEIRRKQGLNNLADSEMYQAFDITYDYDVYHTFRAYLQGKTSLEQYLSLLRRQEVIYPANYLKLRFLENHDQPRIRPLVAFKESLRQWTAFAYFEKGVTLLYAGQENLDSKTPDLFERDSVDWSSPDLEFSNLLTSLARVKKEPLVSRGYYKIHFTPQSGVIFASYQDEHRTLYGIFNVEGKSGYLDVGCKDGEYQNLINGDNIRIQDGLLQLPTSPLIFYGKN
ncbi:MAG TPA: alpha-amylase [Firmicutes bacterium]|jgi:glycosidase|nr:alpha-amylase [Bacillota bacterium]